MNNETDHNENEAANVAAVAGVTADEQPAAAHKAEEPHKTKHTWLEKSAVAIAVLAFLAAAGQGWVARDTEERSLRAYIGLDSAVPVHFEPTRIVATMNNFGQTPANHVKFFSNFEFLPYGENLPRDFTFSDKPLCEQNRNTMFSSSPVFPKNVLEGQRIHCPGEAEKLMQAERKGLDAFFYGHIEYIDVFGYSRRTNFCFLYNQPGGLIVCDRYNEIDP